MGSCLSGFAPPHLVDEVDGNDIDYQKRYLEDDVLGQGEFGVVKLVHDIQQLKQQQQTQGKIETESIPLACKILQKGVVFKDNTLYSPLKPEILIGEIKILRTLAGKEYCLQLHAVYESPKKLYVITECCLGGTMTQYVAAQGIHFTIDDVSRISYQLLSAIHHCSKYHIIHRDIKPDNIMFVNSQPGAAIRLIDFGSGCIDVPSPSSLSSDPANTEKEYINGYTVHKTHAGSAFYISPEVFNRSYTVMTDVWSVGVTLYVLVAGYPADSLQKAFNILLSEKRDLHSLPNIPKDIPESFYTLLDGCLTYWYKKRPSPKVLLSYEFTNLHLQKQENDDPILQEDDPTIEDDNDVSEMKNNNFFFTTTTTVTTAAIASIRRNSISLAGSVVRHNLFLDFQHHERSITALLATLLSKSELEQLIFLLNKRVIKSVENEPQQLDFTDDNNKNKSEAFNDGKLAVVPISDLKQILQDDLFHTEIVDKLNNLPNSNQYDNFAYHTALLNDFVIRDNAAKNVDDGFGGRLTHSAHKLVGSIRQMTGSNTSSVHSTPSLRNSRTNPSTNTTATTASSSSSTRRHSQQPKSNMFKSVSYNSLKNLNRSISQG